MKKLKGIGLLLLSNILIVVTLSITFTILSQVILPNFGIDIRGIVSGSNLLFAAFFGFGGATLLPPYIISRATCVVFGFESRRALMLVAKWDHSELTLPLWHPTTPAPAFPVRAQPCLRTMGTEVEKTLM